MGLGLAALLVFALRVPASGGALGATVQMKAVAPGELIIRNFSFFAARGISAGGPRSQGRLKVQNITVGPADVRFRLRPRSHELDEALRVELRAGGRTLASGTLGELERWSRPVRIGLQETAAVGFRAWLPRDAQKWQGRSVMIEVEARVRLADSGK
jgi:hypothetical protein